MQLDPLLQLINLIGLPVLGFFIKRWIDRSDEDIKAARAEAHNAIGTLAKTVEDWRGRTEADINAVGERLNRYQVEVAEKYVSGPRLDERLTPIVSGIIELKGGQERIFERLDRKADKGIPA